MMNLTPGQAQFMNWLQSYDAALYEVATKQLQSAIAKTPRTGNSLAAYEGGTDIVGPPAPTQSFWDRFSDGFSNTITSITSAVKNVLPAYQDYRVQKAVVDTQIKRVKQGLPLLETPPANAKPLSEAERIAIYNAMARQGLTESKPPLFSMEKLTPVLPWMVGGIFLWALTTKKKGR